MASDADDVDTYLATKSAAGSAEEGEEGEEGEGAADVAEAAAGSVVEVAQLDGALSFRLKGQDRVFILPRKAGFCWLMPCDKIVASLEALSVGRKSKGTLALPPFVCQNTGQQAVARYLKDSQISPWDAGRMYQSFLLHLDATRCENVFEMLCHFSLPRFRAEGAAMFPSDPQLMGVALRKWYWRQTLRRVWNLQLTASELRASFLDANALYRLAVEKSPYLVPGVGGAKAALICAMMGRRPSKPERAMGEVVTAIYQQLRSYGNMAVPEAALRQEVPAYAGVKRRLFDSGGIKAIRTGGKAMLLLGGVWSMLDGVARHLAQSSPSFTAAPPRPTEWNDSALSADQQEAIATCLSQRFALVEGEAGTGKTRTIPELAYQAMKRGELVRVCSFTGKAALRDREAFLEAGLADLLERVPITTIHRLRYTKSGNLWPAPARSDRSSERQPCRLILDEASTISTSLFSSLLLRHPGLRCASMNFFADRHQLSPIEKGQLYAQLRRAPIPRCRLKTNFRFAGKGRELAQFATWVLACRKDKSSAGEPPQLKSVHLLRGSLDNAKNLLRRLVKRKGLLPSQLGVICPYRREVEELNVHMRELYRDPAAYQICRDGRQFSRGDRVAMTRNDYYNDVFNGERGVVVAVKGEMSSPAGLTDTDRSAPVLSVQFESVGGAERVVRFYDTPPRRYFDEEEEAEDAEPLASVRELNYGYAHTVHKAEGSQWPKVFLYLGGLDRGEMLLNNEVLYTAVTRAQEELWLMASDLETLTKAAATKPDPYIDPTAALIAEYAARGRPQK